MAKTDIDNYKQDERPALTAEDAVAPYGELFTDVENREAAAAAGVKDASFIDYAEALELYEDREDIEPLAERRAREVADTFAATDFMRAADEPVVSSGP